MIDDRCRGSFERQGLMRLLGAELFHLGEGRAVIEVPFREDLTQQHGYFHAGVVSSIADTAAGYAAYSAMPPDSSVLTVEFKINLLNPARGERLRAEAEVRKAGRTLVVVSAGARHRGRYGYCLRRIPRDDDRLARHQRFRAAPPLIIRASACQGGPWDRALKGF